MPGQLSQLVCHLRQLLGARPVAASSDRQLLANFVATRDEAAFAALVERHGRLVLSVCRRLLADPHEADDAFQATFMVLARKAGSIRRPDALGTFLYGVAYRVAARARRPLGQVRTRFWPCEP